MEETGVLVNRQADLSLNVEANTQPEGLLTVSTEDTTPTKKRKAEDEEEGRNMNCSDLVN
jgi:hypothetical protein